eukprot:GFUD01064205.1.p1 GENE.GFUD01064205.1~~GFUD01064205.1.p1  ORF type:complete len:220 (+),score=60.04 GFUD01064205.1:88-747(+)
MENGHLRSSSLKLASWEGKGESVSRIKSLHRQLSNTLKKRNQLKEVTKNCNNEFDFVNFDTIGESHTMVIDEIEKAKILIIRDETIDGIFKKVTSEDESCDENIRKGSRKGILWQQTDRIFSFWQERFFVLTENSLYSFSRENKKLEKLEKAVSKIKLSDMSYVSLMDKKGQLVIVIVTKKFGKIFLRKPEGLKDWYEQILENVSAIKFPNQRKKFKPQ